MRIQLLAGKNTELYRLSCSTRYHWTGDAEHSSTPTGPVLLRGCKRFGPLRTRGKQYNARVSTRAPGARSAPPLLKEPAFPLEEKLNAEGGR